MNEETSPASSRVNPTTLIASGEGGGGEGCGGEGEGGGGEGEGGGGEGGGGGGGGSRRGGGGAKQVETVPSTPSVRVVGQEQTVAP